MSNQFEETLRQHKKLGLRSGRAQAGMITIGQGNDVTCQVELGMASEVTVSIDSNVLETAGLVAFTQATVTFTIEGVSITRTFDVAAGASISGLAEAVRVMVKDVTPTVFSQSKGKKYGVTISIAMMPRPNTAVPPTLTGVSNVSVAGLNTLPVPVPLGASSVIVTGSGAAGVVSLQVAQQTADGGENLMLCDLTSVPSPPIALMAGCGIIAITNLAASSVANVTVQFGIDG
jgi:hypothetical protein